MKKPELLAPAGNIECLYAAINAGADAVYLGGKKFGAREFASNFNNEEIINAINYAHLYGAKIYVTVNTLIYEEEVYVFLEYIKFLHKNNVDAVIIQDIGMLDLIRKTYPSLEVHASTQMHIHNKAGVKFVKSLGVKRIVLARETNIEDIKSIKNSSDIELEIFVHGALCVSYSGQCLMSSLIGGRSGNRGSCAGSCRLPYDIVMEDGKKLNTCNYALSMKDLNTLDNIGELIDVGVDSFKIEGRMKSPEYVYYTVLLYRKAIDDYIKTKTINITKEEIINLKKLFNREFTKGFLFDEANDNVINPNRPNHIGIEIGKIIDKKKDRISIELIEDLSLNDGIRIIGDKDTGFIVTSIYKNEKKVLEAKAGEIISLPIKEDVKVSSKVLKTSDYLLDKEIKTKLKEEKKIDVDIHIEAIIDSNLKIEISDGKNRVEVLGISKIEKAFSSPVNPSRIIEQITKLGGTPYKVNKITTSIDDNIFISIKEINDLRRQAVLILNDKRMYKTKYSEGNYNIEVKDYKKAHEKAVLVNTLSQYNKIKENKFNTLYLKKNIYNLIDDNRKILKLDRVNTKSISMQNGVLIGEMGSLYHENMIADFSLNVTNSYTVAFLHSIGVDKVTLFHELTDFQISKLIDSYKKKHSKHPNLELIAYAKEEAMITKFKLNDYFKTDKRLYLKDRFANLYQIETNENFMIIYNHKFRNVYDKKYYDMGINSLRFVILDEEDVKNVSSMLKDI